MCLNHRNECVIVGSGITSRVIVAECSESERVGERESERERERERERVSCSLQQGRATLRCFLTNDRTNAQWGHFCAGGYTLTKVLNREWERATRKGGKDGGKVYAIKTKVGKKERVKNKIIIPNHTLNPKIKYLKPLALTLVISRGSSDPRNLKELLTARATHK